MLLRKVIDPQLWVHVGPSLTYPNVYVSDARLESLSSSQSSSPCLKLYT